MIEDLGLDTVQVLQFAVGSEELLEELRVFHGQGHNSRERSKNMDIFFREIPFFLIDYNQDTDGFLSRIERNDDFITNGESASLFKRSEELRIARRIVQQSRFSGLKDLAADTLIQRKPQIRCFR